MSPFLPSEILDSIPNIRNYVGEHYWNHRLEPVYRRIFQSNHPDLFSIFVEVGRREERSNYPKMFLRAASQYSFLNDVVVAKALVFDEGLCQFAPEVLALDRNLGEQYLQRVPLPDIIVCLSCKPRTSLSRQRAREKPIASSLAGLPEDDAINRLEQYRDEFQSSTQTLKDRGATVVEFDTTDKSTAIITAEVQELIEEFTRSQT